MTRLKQQARVMAAVMAANNNAAPLDIAALIADHRARWNYQRQWGVKRDLTLPPLDAAQAEDANRAAHRDYWSGTAHVVFGEYKAWLDDVRAAIAAAQERHCAELRAALSPEWRAAMGEG